MSLTGFQELSGDHSEGGEEGGMLPPSPPKGREGTGENYRGGVGTRGRRIVLMQIKVVKLGNLGRTT